MRSCYQFKDMSVLQHGKSVHEWYLDFIGPRKRQWRMPDWADDKRIREGLLPLETTRLYQTYHDCGKPFCRTVDTDGRQHFPDHAEVSYKRWLECSEASPESLLIAELIRKDMLAHTAKGEQIEAFCKEPLAIPLLVTALCEVHSNAQIFSGIESDSFKIKWKVIDKIGKRLLKKLDSDLNVNI